MLQFLLVLRQLFYPIVSSIGVSCVGRDRSSVLFSIYKLYWRFFWYLEWRLEAIELSAKGTSISGSERAVLIESILFGLKNPKILEVGVGFGQNLAILCVLIPEKNLAAIDLDEKRVSATNEFLLDNNIKDVSVSVADATKLPFEDSSFEVVFTSAVFLYLSKEDAVSALLESLRVSKKRVVLLEQHIDGIEDREFEGGVVGGKYIIRDYLALINSLGLDLKVEEKRIPNPRWGVEEWQKAARVFVIEKVSNN